MQNSDQSYLLSNPVTFNLQSDGRKIEASFVSASFLTGVGYRLNITFSDGHSDQYELDCFKVYNPKGEIDPYCRMLNKEIYNPLWGWTPDTHVTVIDYPVNKKTTNIWIIQKEDYSSIYFNNQFQYKITKKETGWVLKMSEGTTIDEELLKKAKAVVQYYLQEA